MCLYLGMLTGKYNGRISVMKAKNCLIGAGISALCVLFMAHTLVAKGFILDKGEWLGSADNPPGLSLILYAFAVMICICLWDKAVSNMASARTDYLIACLAWVGRETLYIFLYHKLFLDFFLNRYFTELNRMIKIPLYYLIMVLGSIGMGYLYRYLRKLIVTSYTFVKEK